MQLVFDLTLKNLSCMYPLYPIYWLRLWAIFRNVEEASFPLQCLSSAAAVIKDCSALALKCLLHFQG